MRISIAMTTYRGARFVERQLQSLLNQSRAADEVIIIDDCSTDNTAEVVASFIESHSLSNWHFRVNENNLGYKANFKLAISQTTGDYIFLADQDDVWHPDKLERMAEILGKHPECRSLNTGFRYIDGEGAPIATTPVPGMSNCNLIKRPIAPGALEKITFEELTSYNISPGCTMAFSTELKKLYLTHTVCGVVHDWEINFLAALSEGCYFWNEPLIDYRIHDSNAVGIPGVSAENQVDRGSYIHRLAVAKQMLDYTACFRVYEASFTPEQKEIYKAQLAFVTARYQALAGKSMFRLLALYRYRKNYKNSVTTKGRLADIACVLRPVKK